MIKRLVIAAILIVIVCGGLIGFNLFKIQAINKFFAERKAPPVVVADTVVKAVTWTPGIDALGTAYASEGVNVPAAVAGVVKQIEFKANQHVEEGQVLVVQDDAIEQASLVSAQAAVNLDRQALDRAQALAKRESPPSRRSTMPRRRSRRRSPTSTRRRRRSTRSGFRRRSAA